MQKKTCSKIIGLLLLVCIKNVRAQKAGDAPAKPAWATETAAQKEQRMEWWRNDRFGMFVHWGLYSVAARHEWVKSREKMSDSAYDVYFRSFDPDLYDPEAWARSAKEAGMKYVVLTTKHHDGFCLWDSKYTNYKATRTPAGRDLIKLFTEACKKQGIRVGFYYSVIDWHHPDFTVDRIHPLRDNAAARKDPKRTMTQYRQYIKDQLTELLTNYGTIDELFLDYSYPGKDGKGHADWNATELLQLVRKLQPQVIINDRLDLDKTSWGWDYKTPEQFMPEKWPEVNGVRVPWETCQTFSGSWGYFRDEYSWKSPRQLLSLLIGTVSKGGNLLLNVGPTARGTFDARATERLEAIGQWMKLHQRAIYNCTAAPDDIKKPDNCLLTYNPQTRKLYVHILEWPLKSIHLPGLKGRIQYARLLEDGSELLYKENILPGSHTTETANDGDILMELPTVKPPSEIPVIEITLK